MAETAPTPASERPGLRLRLRRARRRLMFLGVQMLLRQLAFDGAHRVGRTLGDLQYRFGGGLRRRMERDLARLLGRPEGDAAVRETLRESYRVNDAAVFEIMALMERRQDAALLAARCDIQGLDALRAATAPGRGAILLAAHMGNAALLPIRLAQEGWPVSVIYKQSRMGSDGFFHAGFERYGVQPIVANAGIRAYGQMLAALKQGRVVFIMLDQGVKKAADGLPQRFLGKTMSMPAGPAQLARTARAPVLPVATTAASPVWRFSIGEPVPLGHATLGEDLAALVAATERVVLAHPELWSWHHRRWRHFPLAAEGH